MTHPAPTKVTIEPVVDERFADITFFGSTYPPATARYPRAEVAQWVEKWLAGKEQS